MKQLMKLQLVANHVDKSDKMQVERLEEMKRLIFDQMKTTIKKKMDARGEKRNLDTSTSDNVIGHSKARTSSPSKQ